MDKAQQVRAASLLLDYNLYPRHKVDSTHVSHLRTALRAGEELPPVLADEDSQRLVDGFHRVCATLAEYGDDAEISVQFWDYPTEADMIEDAILHNSGHGSNLTPYDRVRCVVLADDYGLDADRLAKALRAPLAEVEDLKLRRTAKVGREAKITPIKSGFGHLKRRKKITKKQAKGMEAAGGLSRTYYVNEVIRTIRHDLADWENPKFVERLTALRDLLNRLDLDDNEFAAS